MERENGQGKMEVKNGGENGRGKTGGKIRKRTNTK